MINNTVISGNVQSASSTTGPATVQGNGIVNNGVLELRNVQISNNVGTATGPTGFAQGGGIWNGLLFNIGVGRPQFVTGETVIGTEEDADLDGGEFRQVWITHAWNDVLNQVRSAKGWWSRSSVPVKPSLAVKTRRPAELTKSAGYELLAPSRMSFKRNVPEEVPLLLRQSSTPATPSLAEK